MSIEKHQVGVLLSQIALRDRKAFEALYQLTSTRLFNVIVSVVKDEQQAADILQDGFVKLWHGRQRYPIDHPWAWLCQAMTVSYTFLTLRPKHTAYGSDEHVCVLQVM